MIDFLKRLFGITTVNFRELYNRGAIILDVRTPAEFKTGHIAKAVNIPLQELGSRIEKLDKRKPIITCSASGMRSGSAKAILKRNGFQAYNGGGWNALNSKLK